MDIYQILDMSFIFLFGFLWLQAAGKSWKKEIMEMIVLLTQIC